MYTLYTNRSEGNTENLIVVKTLRDFQRKPVDKKQISCFKKSVIPSTINTITHLHKCPFIMARQYDFYNKNYLKICRFVIETERSLCLY